MAEETNAATENTNTEVGSAGEETTAPTPDTTPEGNSEGEQNGTLLGDKKPAEDSDKEEDKSGAPENYDFTEILPEGAVLDEKEAEAFSAIAKDLNLSQEQANKLAKYGFDYLGRGIGAYEAQRQAESKGWAETARKELGADFDNTLVTCAKGIEAVEKLVPNLRQALNETGAGNRVEIIKAFKMLGEALQEDTGKGATGGTSGMPAKTWFENSDMKND